MNVWKPIALVSVAALALSVGVQVANARTGEDKSVVQGVCHDQPNMANAAASLKAARASLGKAEHNKDGWRVAAIEATDKAIGETDRGCAMAP